MAPRHGGKGLFECNKFAVTGSVTVTAELSAVVGCRSGTSTAETTFLNPAEYPFRRRCTVLCDSHFRDEETVPAATCSKKHKYALQTRAVSYDRRSASIAPSEMPRNIVVHLC